MYILIYFFFHLISSYAFKFNMKYNNWLDLSKSLKYQARNWFINRAEKKGVEWSKIKNQYIQESNELQLIKDITSNNFLPYPTYYQKPFHGYDKGNLNWEAAYEGVPATYSMSSNYWNNVNSEESHNWMRNNYTSIIKDFYETINLNLTSLNILDIGCSIGISTEYIYNNLKNNKVNGLDLSPYFLSIAQYRAKKQSLPINYIHANAEMMPINNNKFDLISIQFLFHEVPKKETIDILHECYRVLKNDSVIAIIDLDPINLTNEKLLNYFRKKLFEITEPHIKEYYNTNMTQILEDIGFTNIKKFSNNDPFNSVWIAHKSQSTNIKLKNYIYNKINEQDILINE